MTNKNFATQLFRIDHKIILGRLNENGKLNGRCIIYCVRGTQSYIVNANFVDGVVMGGPGIVYHPHHSIKWDGKNGGYVNGNRFGKFIRNYNQGSNFMLDYGKGGDESVKIQYLEKCPNIVPRAGVYVYPTGELYVGDLKNGKPNGRGVKIVYGKKLKDKSYLKNRKNMVIQSEKNGRNKVSAYEMGNFENGNMVESIHKFYLYDDDDHYIRSEFVDPNQYEDYAN